MQYLVRLTDRALRDMEAIYEFIEADVSEERAFAWFNDLAESGYGLERFPERGAVIRESKKPSLRHFLFGKKPSTYRIIYAVDKRSHVVNILHIRHGARAAPLGGVRNISVRFLAIGFDTYNSLPGSLHRAVPTRWYLEDCAG